MSDRKDLPAPNAGNFSQRVRETLMTYLGKQGNPLDRGLTLRDLVENGIVKLSSSWRPGGSTTPKMLPGSAMANATQPDLTPPPTPTGFLLSSAISHVMIEHDAPNYLVGHGHLRTHVYGITVTDDAELRTFSDAIELGQFSGAVWAMPSNPSTSWRLWIKWESVDGVLSTSPAGGTNGLFSRTGEDVGTLLDALNSQISESQLAQSLSKRIDLIDTDATGLISRVDGLETVFGDTQSAQTSAQDAALSAQQAAQSLADAASSASSAASSAADAILAKGGAANAQTQAELSATQSAISATNADGSAAAAATSAEAAANSATDSGASADAAALSASSARTAATEAGSFATAASESSVSAQSAKSEAEIAAAAASSDSQTAATSATQAQQSASAASESATSASTSAGSAQTSATQAATSATNAAGSESSAATSASTAATSATNAGNSASAAATSASAASTSATQAQQSASSASTSATTASTKASDAGVHASNAATSATNAAGSASSAATSASTAATSATNAGNSASAAATSASAAATSATNASTSASSASTSATTASTKASDAGVYASNAATSATNAAGSATSAATSLTQVKATIRGTSLGLPLEQWDIGAHSIVTVADGRVGNQALRIKGSGGSYPSQPNFVAIDSTRTYRVRFWARPSSNCTGRLYFSLRQFTSDSLSNSGPVNGGRSPYKPSGYTRSDHISAHGDTWGEYNFKWTSSDWQTGVKYVKPEFLDNYSGAAGYWEIQGFTFYDSTEGDLAYSAVQVEATARAQSDNLLFAKYGVKLDVNGYVTGWEMNNSGSTGSMAIRVDQFSIGSPGKTSITPFVVQASQATVNGVTVPAGVYMDAGYIKNGTITNAKIANAAIDDAKIANLSASKITAGSIGVGESIQSSNYVPGSQGWKILGDGSAEFANANIRGTIYGGQGSWNSGIGFYLGSDGKMSVGSSAGNRLTWDGQNLEIVSNGLSIENGNAVFSGSLSAASGSFGGELVAATGTFHGTLRAGAINVTELVGETKDYKTPGTYTYTVPAGFDSIQATCIGGGGGGGFASDWGGSGLYAGGGGGAGGVTVSKINVTPGTVITIVVGSGGSENNGGGSSYIQIGSTLINATFAEGGSPGGTVYLHYLDERTIYASGGAGGHGTTYGNAGGAGRSSYSTGNFDPKFGPANLYWTSVGGSGASGMWGNGGSGGLAHRQRINGYTTTSYSNAVNGSGYGAGGGGGADTYGGYVRGGTGSGGRVIIESANSIGVVSRNEFQELKAALISQGIGVT